MYGCVRGCTWACVVVIDVFDAIDGQHLASCVDHIDLIDPWQHNGVVGARHAVQTSNVCVPLRSSDTSVAEKERLRAARALEPWSCRAVIVAHVEARKRIRSRQQDVSTKAVLVRLAAVAIVALHTVVDDGIALVVVVAIAEVVASREYVPIEAHARDGWRGRRRR